MCGGGSHLQEDTGPWRCFFLWEIPRAVFWGSVGPDCRLAALLPSVDVTFRFALTAECFSPLWGRSPVFTCGAFCCICLSSLIYLFHSFILIVVSGLGLRIIDVFSILLDLTRSWWWVTAIFQTLTSLFVMIILKNSIAFCNMGFPGGSDSKESACNSGNLGSILGLGRSPGKGNGNPLQYSCLENPHGRRSLAGYSPWGCKYLVMTEQT